jgi:hypothetical protein
LDYEFDKVLMLKHHGTIKWADERPTGGLNIIIFTKAAFRIMVVINILWR